ncbi:MAG: hypothetical protein ACYS6W_14910 [Planctomycetota bacterium]
MKPPSGPNKTNPIKPNLKWLSESCIALSYTLAPHSFGVVTNPPNSYTNDDRPLLAVQILDLRRTV